MLSPRELETLHTEIEKLENEKSNLKGKLEAPTGKDDQFKIKELSEAKK